jgi:hypothetical protein
MNKLIKTLNGEYVRVGYKVEVWKFDLPDKATSLTE